MSTVLDWLKTTALWNSHWKLPLYPGNNPAIYLAYTDLCARLMGERMPRDEVQYLFSSCVVPGKRPLVYRWPSGVGGPNSHDEVMGWAHLDEELAGELLDYLEKEDGMWDSHGLSWNSKPERYNIWRFPWLRPYLQACAGRRVSLFSQLIWCSRLLMNLRKLDTSKHGPKPRLMDWLMSYKMRQFPLCDLTWRFYRSRLEKKRIWLSHNLSQEPDGVPQGGTAYLSSFAPELWLHPQDLGKL